MALRALKWASSSPSAPASAIDLDPALLASIDRGATTDLPVAYVVAAADLAVVRRLKGAVVDCGTKRPNRALSDLALGRARVPIIVATFKRAGQAVRSVKALLERATRTGDRNAYVVGVPEDVFDELSRQAGQSSADAPSGEEDPTELLLQLLSPRPVPPDLVERYVGDSVEVRLVRQLIVRAAERDDPVLILGEMGSGKQLVARAIHEHGRRCREKFVAVNCGAIARELLESELFGHERGAFKGARRKKIGLCQVADRGTLFLDDVGDLPPDLQGKLLRALRERVISPKGADDDVRVDTRVIAASDGDLFSMVQARQFRDDLYYSLRAMLIRTPSLRRHPADVPAIAQFFWRGIAADPGAALSDEVIDELRSYRWPGNARELRAALMSVFTLFGGKRVTVNHLRAVFHLDGRDGIAGPLAADAARPDVRALECVRHLHEVDEAVQAVSVAVRPLKASRATRQTLRGLHLALGHRLQELDALCRRPALFHGEVAFTIVRRLYDRLPELRRLLLKDVSGARAYWRREVAPEVRLATSAVLQELRVLQAAR